MKAKTKCCNETITLEICSSRAEVEQQIRDAAYYLWEEAGKPEGREIEFWLAAEDLVSKAQ